MPTARYTGGGTYRVGGHNFRAGDAIDVNDDLAAHLDGVDEFEVVDDTDDVREEDGPPDGPSAPPILATDATVAKLKDVIADIDDPDAVRYILDDERDGPNRTTAIDALETRLAELED